MVRRSVRAFKSARRGSSTVPAIVALAGMGLLFGFVLLWQDGGAPSPHKTPVAAAKDVQSVKADAPQPAQTVKPSTPEAPQQPVAPQVDASQTRLAQVAAHLAAGEFGLAIEIAESTPDARERTDLLKQVVQAQLDAADFEGALASIRRIPIPEERARARAQRTDVMSLAGGGSGADFTQLIELIQSETSGLWEEEDGTGGSITEYETGVRVDPNGQLAQLTRVELKGRLNELGAQARAADLNEDMARPSRLRLISLKRLEREVAARIERGEPVVETMQNLAGLTRIQYVFVYPESGEIVIGGPAEGWSYNQNGLPVGSENGRPTMQLDDLVTVLRTFDDNGRQIFGCSINPRQQGLAALKEYVAQRSGRALNAGAGVRNYVRALQEKLGLQDIEIYGVPATSRVARVIVEADYRMKLIGIGKLDGGSHIPSIFDLFTVEEQKSGKLDALRWWLSMKYDTVLHSPDRNIFEIQGSSVLCQSENQFVTAQGQRVQTGKSDATNSLFAGNFTDHYAELAQREIIFADLQNIFDEALLAALIHRERIAARVGWDLGVFATGGAYRPAEYEAPKVVESVVNHRVYRGKDVVVQVAGGVRADVLTAIKSETALQSVARLANIAGKGEVPQLPEGRWWWDAK